MELSYKELFEKYNLLLEENRNLKKEIAELRTRPNFYESKITSKKETFDFAINKFSSPQDKIELFRSLFKGRDDVFSRRWHSKTLGKSGYRPVCKNEWDETLCDKKKYKHFRGLCLRNHGT